MAYSGDVMFRTVHHVCTSAFDNAQCKFNTERYLPTLACAAVDKVRLACPGHTNTVLGVYESTTRSFCKRKKLSV